MKTVDPNGDGQLEYKEILPMLKAPRTQAAATKAAAAPATISLDKEKDAGDGIDYNAMPTDQAANAIWDKMRSYMKDKGGQRATDLFKEMDKDRGGKIDADEFIAVLERMGIRNVSKKLAKAVMKTVDPNGDGQLEYKEILPMLKAPRTHAAATKVTELAPPAPAAKATSPAKSSPPAAATKAADPALPPPAAAVEVSEGVSGNGMDYNAMPTDQAANAIWDKMRSYMKDKGGQRATDLFKEMDKDRSGKIDADEFIAALERMGIRNVSKKVAKAVMKTVDPNGDGQLEYKEILPMLKAPRGRGI
jgi:Ca2+-binding EF-hand superfamily protein